MPKNLRRVNVVRGRRARARVDRLELLRDLRVPADQPAEARRVEEIADAFFAAGEDEIGAWHPCRPAGTEVDVVHVERRPVRRRERAGHAERRGAEFHEAIGEAGDRSAAVVHAVARRVVNGAARIDDRPAAGLPDAAEAAVGRRIEDAGLVERRLVVGHRPAMVRPRVAVTRPADVDGRASEAESRSLVVLLRVEVDDAAARIVAIAGDARGNHLRAARAIAAVGDADAAQALDEGRSSFDGSGDEVHRASGAVDDRRPDDTDVAAEVVVGVAPGVDESDLGVEHGDSGPVEVTLPEGTASVVGVERVDGVVHRRDVDHVVDAARDRNARGVEQAGVDLIVDPELKEFAELVAVDVASVERRLAEVRTAAQVVVVSREDVERAKRRFAAARVLEIELRTATAAEKSQYRHRAHNTN